MPWSTICSRRPLRRPISCVTTPTYISGMSIAMRSIGSHSVPSIRTGHHFGLSDRELKALASHCFHEHRELQFAAPLDRPGVRVGRLTGP